MKLLLYCTKAKPYLYKHFKGDYLLSNTYEKLCINNGKVVGECDFEIEEIKLESDEVWNEWFETSSLDRNGLLEKSCLTEDELYDYLYKHIENGKNGYAIHIKNLKIYDKPKELSDFAHYIDEEHTSVITKAPQNMMYAYEIDGCFLKRNILISIHPEWLCKILNGEKTIECRKRILKGMITK